MPAELPCGEWPSPISAADVARNSGGVGSALFVDGTPYWSELRPDEGGRTAICRRGDGAVVDVLPAPWNARTRVHEYGGGAWTMVGRTLVFANFADQRLYAISDDAEPRPLTPEPPEPAGVRYGDLVPAPDGTGVLCVRESHAGASVTRDIVHVPLDGGPAEPLVGGSHFLAYPRISPDGRRLAWIGWEHPQMPWDGTELFVAERTENGWSVGRPLLGSTTESVLQPEWVDGDRLRVISDRSGWWNLYTLDVRSGGEPEPLYLADGDVGGPLWGLGMRRYDALPDGRVVAVRTVGLDTLLVIDPQSGAATDVTPDGWEAITLAALDGDRVLAVSSGSTLVAGLRLLDLATGAISDIRVDAADLPPADYLPRAQPRVFTGPGGRDVHAFVYPPTSPVAVPSAGELPPYMMLVHGGPTGHVPPRLSVEIAYFTSRGIGVVDVNYGGSTGYGRAYRERLRGQWGVVDVEDCVAVAHGLAMAGLADAHRIAIEGASAGGWTVLAAVTRTDAFGCGISRFGVADARMLAEHTHDFESRYLDGLIGPLPEAEALYDERSPLSHVDELSCPVLLLQGLDDPIVPPAQAERFRDAMAAKGIPHEYIAFAGESHGFRKSETLIRATEAMLAFLGEVFGFSPHHA